MTSSPQHFASDIWSKVGLSMQLGSLTVKKQIPEIQPPISVGSACRAGLRGHAATSAESRSKGRPRGLVEWMCDLWRFALRRKSFPAERT